MANTDHLVFAALEDLAQEAGPFESESLERQIPLAEIRRHATECEAEALGQCILQRDAFSDGSFDEDTDHTLAARARDQAMGLGALDIQAARDLRLRHSSSEIEPRSARRERRLAIDHGQPIGRYSHARKACLQISSLGAKNCKPQTGRQALLMLRRKSGRPATMFRRPNGEMRRSARMRSTVRE